MIRLRIFILDQPVYLCPQGHLWITDPRAKPTATVLANLGSANSHIVPDRIVFAHWQQSDSGKWAASVVRQNPTGGFDLVQSKQTTPLASNRKWLWDRAMAWDDKIVVPSDHGVSIFSVNNPTNESYQPLIDDSEAKGKTTSPPIVLFDTAGILAWMPWESNLTGSQGAARFANGKWTRLDPSQGWPDKILQLMPLLDGSILQLIPDDDGSIKLQMSGVAHDAGNINEGDVQRLVEQLSDPDQINRDAAYEQLTRYGPGVLPILEKLQDNQPPAAQSRIAELLKSKVNLTLGPITPQHGPVMTAARLSDGGVVLYSDAGVSVARGSNEHPNVISPAWLCIRPGNPVQVVPTRLTENLQPGKQKLWAFKNEWIVGDEASGLSWFVGNSLSPLQHKDEYRFSEFFGVDIHGRWIMKTPQPDGSTLIVDPNLPDPTPRLPVWVYVQREGTVGWTNTNWPAVKPKGVAVLDVGSWRDPTKDEKFFQKESEMPNSAPATEPSTTQAAADLILIDKDGTRYFGGSTSLRFKTADGHETTWNLPADAVGTGDVWLFHCGEDRFFLFNQPGRVLRLRRTPKGPEPFILEATFTHHIPNSNPERIWLDPAGRIVIAYNGNTLAILFPSGQIPPDTQQMMPAGNDSN